MKLDKKQRIEQSLLDMTSGSEKKMKIDGFEFGIIRWKYNDMWSIYFGKQFHGKIAEVVGYILERLEQEKMCNFCKGVVSIEDGEKHFDIMLKKNKLEIAFDDYCGSEGSSDSCIIIISYCPMCGERLKND